MLLEFDDDQRFWQSNVQELLHKRCAPAVIRDIAEGGADDGHLWQLYVDHGWTELAEPESCVELAIALEEMGRVTDPTPYLATMSQFAPLAGERFDPKRSGAAVYEGVTAHRDGAGWVLNGTARFVLDGDRAESYAVLTAAGVFLINGETPIAREASVVDPVLHVADVVFDGVQAAEGDRRSVDTEKARHVALTGLAIHIVGACQRILDLTLEHVKERRQFGVPIGSFQAIQHRVADMHVAIERARALAYFAALAIAADDPRRRLAAAMAKAAAGEAQSLVVRGGMQSFGAMAVTWENDLQFAVKRAKAANGLLGGAEEHRSMIAKEYRAADF